MNTCSGEAQARRVAPACHLRLLEDEDGLRYYLDGKPVHAGDSLALLLGYDPKLPIWLPVRFEWSHRFGTRPILFFSVPGSTKPGTAHIEAHMPLPDGALFRRPA